MKEMIGENALPLAQKTASAATYLAGAGLVVGDAIDWLDNHAGAVGVLIGVATFFVNFYFQYKRSKGE